MATKEQAIKNALYMLKRCLQKPMYIYKVGPGWMFTSHSEKVTQELYERKIKNYQEIKPDE